MMRVRAASQGWTGAPGLNTVYFVSGDAGPMPEDTDAQLAHDRVHAAFTDAVGLYPTAWNVTVSPAVDIIQTEDGELINSFSVTPSAQVNGTSGTGFGPIAAMLLCSMNTSTFNDGSRIQGRAYLGPLTAVHDTNGTPAAGLVANAVSFGTALADAGAGGVPKVVVWRRPRLAKAGPPVVTARDGAFGIVTSYTVPDKYAVLRSRRD